ncbi:uncharacterized protein LOC100902093 [Galendromus occidentalis]|uniref:Uncharacterized protein LOC100902093 n=1 Tax=Galendromus occidentalis TaxID=34638 RepID=A0AAJ6W0U1_9ACAR|nr:uncharacterized protein LOC100902093 [Galendromus occidentalis]
MPLCGSWVNFLVFLVLSCVSLFCVDSIEAGDVGWTSPAWDQQWQVPHVMPPSHWQGEEVYSVEGPIHEPSHPSHFHHHHEPPRYKVRTVTKIVRKVPKTVTHSYTTYGDDDEPWISLHVDRKHRPKPTILLNGWAKDGKFGLTLNIH